MVFGGICSYFASYPPNVKPFLPIVWSENELLSIHYDTKLGLAHLKPCFVFNQGSFLDNFGDKMWLIN